jgi:hypothetical protein
VLYPLSYQGGDAKLMGMKPIVVLGLVAALTLSGAAAPAGAAPHAPAASVALAPYSGLGTWVDLYNEKVWKHPERVVDEMSERGVQTLYLETSSYKFKKAIVHPNATGDFIDLAHDAGITVVAWYVPSFKPLKRDLRRVVAALEFVSPNAGRFDSFALDIEATVVQDIDERNDRARRLSREIRNYAGDAYQLGAIIPNPIGSLYWSDFPYRAIAKQYDVFLPMSYFTYRVKGAKAVYRHVRAGIRAVHHRTNLPHAAIHPIGGIADAARAREVRAYVRAVFRGRALGGSFYDFPITRGAQWEALARLRSRRIGAGSTGSAAAAPAWRHPHAV